MGAGPAGATAALHLAPLCRVLLVDKYAASRAAIGESLAAASHRLLTEMRLSEAFARDGHLPCYEKQSTWGAPSRSYSDSLRDLDGPSFRLDRARFEQLLRDTAVRRGAALLAPARVLLAARSGVAFDLTVRTADRTVGVRSRFLIDAGGRTSALLRGLGAVRERADDLVCSFVIGPRERRSCNVTYTESDPDGWWYSAPLPGDRRILAYHTDRDLPAARELRSPRALLARAARLDALSAQLADAQFSEHARLGVCAAYSARLSTLAGEGFVATGDAALSFDPLSSQGLFQALYSGISAAFVAHEYLEGRDESAAYEREQERIWSAYRRHLALYYAEERRYADRPFWLRRHALPECARRVS